MENNNIAKLQKLSRLGSMMLSVGIAFCILLLLVCIGGFAVFTFIPEILEESRIYENLTELQIAMVMSAMGVTMVMILLALANKVLKNIRDKHTPFIPENAQILRSFSIILLIYAIIIPIVNYVLLWGFLPDAEMVVPFNVGLVLVAILVYCMSLIFGYGVVLQKESDETL